MLTSVRVRSEQRNGYYRYSCSQSYGVAATILAVHLCLQPLDDYSLLSAREAVHSPLIPQAGSRKFSPFERQSHPAIQACVWKRIKSSSGLLYLGKYLLHILYSIALQIYCIDHQK